MKEQEYLKNVVTLDLDTDKCIGCGMCTIVCPHSVFKVEGNIAKIIDKDACMECGACSLNCPASAISVRAGVGCAYGILMGKLMRKMPNWLYSEKLSCCSHDNKENTDPCCTGEGNSDKPC